MDPTILIIGVITMKWSICQILAIFLIFGLLFTSAIGPSISLVYAHTLIERTIVKEEIVDEITETVDVYKKIE